jgi:hypothetical protein
MQDTAHLRRTLLASLCMLLTACTQFPELDETIAPEVARQPYPTLTPQDDILATANTTDVDEEEVRSELANRGGALNTRAAALSARQNF